jgi:hypothetical protein
MGDCMQFTDPADRDRKGTKASDKANIGWAVIGVGGAVALVGFVKGFVVGGNKETAVSSKARRGRTEMVVTPVVTDRSAGATLHFRW